MTGVAALMSSISMTDNLKEQLRSTISKMAIKLCTLETWNMFATVAMYDAVEESGF